MDTLDVPAGDIDLLAVGEALVDFISVEETARLDEATAFRPSLGGSPANIAVNVAKLGGTAAVVSRVGDDAWGRYVTRSLAQHGVITEFVAADRAHPTTVVFVGRTRTTPDFSVLRGADARLSRADVMLEAVQRARVVHGSAFAVSSVSARFAVERAFRLGSDLGKLLSFDPNYAAALWPAATDGRAAIAAMLARAALTKPSVDDSRRFFGDDATPEAYLERWHALGPEIVVLTMGLEGALVSSGSGVVHVPAVEVEVVDATGAGDAYWAGFIVALLDGMTLERCARFAAAVAARKLATMGHIAGSLDRAAIEARLG